MGWDVAEIGLGHNLPYNDPKEMAIEISKRMKANIIISVCAKEIGSYDYHEFLELETISYQGSEINYNLEIHGKKLISKYINSNSPIIEFENKKYILDNFDNYDNYVLQDSDLMISIYREYVSLDVCVMERWSWWEYSFHHRDERSININEYRKQIYEQAQLFGCNKVAIMSDQGPTDYIYSNMGDKTLTELLDYINEYKYLDEYYKDSPIKWTADDYIHINIPDYLKSSVLIPPSQTISVMFDDFSDFK